MTDARSGIHYIIILIKMDFFFVEGSDKSFGVAVLPRTSSMSWGNLNPMTNERGKYKCSKDTEPLGHYGELLERFGVMPVPTVSM